MDIELETEGGLELTEWLNNDQVREFRHNLEGKIIQFLFSNDPSSLQFQQTITQLARVGSCFENRALLEREIALLNGPFEIDLCKSKLLKWANKVGHFFNDHKAEIAVALAICATGLVLSAVTGYAISAKVGGVVIAGANSVFQKEEKPNLHIPKVSASCWGNDVSLPKLALPPTTEELVVVSGGVWVQGEFFPDQEPVNITGFSPWFNLETIYREEYVSELYRQFKLPDPYQEVLIQERLPPDYIDSFTKEAPGKWSFAQHIENKLNEVKSPDYLKKLLDPSYMPTLQKVKEMFPQSEPLPDRPNPPFFEVPRLGLCNQKTVHFHCGIANNFSSIVDGGLKLGHSLDREFAIQPHLIHSNNLVEGLFFVGLEKLDVANQKVPLAGVTPGALLQHSKIQKSIDYEVENLSRIAQEIVAKNNPKLKQLHVTFSNGGYVFREALKQLPKEYRDTIVVITTGTTAIIEDSLACKVYNIIGDKDWPSQFCNGGMSGIEAAKEWATVETIYQEEADGVIGGHYFIQKDYQGKISQTIKKEINNEGYEIYQ